MTKYDKKIIKDSKTVEEMVTRICGYGYYDYNGVDKKIIEKYVEMGVQWGKEHKDDRYDDR